MVRSARQLFPHPALDDQIYAEILNDALTATAADGSITAALLAAEAALDVDGPFVDLDDAGQVAMLRRYEQTEFFATIQNAVRSRLYRHPAFLDHIAYPGASFTQGGYLNRGAGEIDWLPEVD